LVAKAISPQVAVPDEVYIPEYSLLGWTFKGTISPFSFDFIEGYELYFRSIDNTADYPKVGQQYGFAALPYPAIHSVAVEIDRRKLFSCFFLSFLMPTADTQVFLARPAQLDRQVRQVPPDLRAPPAQMEPQDQWAPKATKATLALQGLPGHQANPDPGLKPTAGKCATRDIKSVWTAPHALVRHITRPCS
jgi:hypothetical protein